MYLIGDAIVCTLFDLQEKIIFDLKISELTILISRHSN